MTTVDEPSWALLALALTVVLALAAAVLWLSVTEATAVEGRFDGPEGDGQGDRATGAAARSGSGWGTRGSRRRRPPRSAFAAEDRDTTAVRRAAIVVNPTKFADVAAVREQVTRLCREHGWTEPRWLETTVDDPGLGQARQAVEEGVELVCALGGDGTVRTVGSALAGTGVPMGLLPAGTGNLLARNLGLPHDDLRRALVTALTGRNARIDTCQMTLVRPTTEELLERVADEDDPSENVDLSDATDHPAPGARPRTEEHTFLVMAGLGFDAEVMAGAPEQLKRRVGWAAYLVSGARHLSGPQFIVDVTMDDGTRLRRRVRSVVVGNVGRLQGGLVLLPDARSDDGVMDAVLLSPQGIVGWGAVAARLATRRRRGHQRVDFYRCREISVTSTKPVELQLDGDTLGEASAMAVSVAPGSLVVRLPA